METNIIKNISKTTLIFLVVVFLFLGFAKAANAGCSWNGNVGTPTSADVADCQACIDQITSLDKTGDVRIAIPAGSVTWANHLDINMAPMNVTSLFVYGAGQIPDDNTVGCAASGYTQITENTNGVFHVTGLKPTAKLRISNLKLNSSGIIEQYGGSIEIKGTDSDPATGGGFRLDHIDHYSSAVFQVGRGITVDGTGMLYGLISQYKWNGETQFTDYLSSGAGGNKARHRTMDFLGSTKGLYFEKCDLTNRLDQYLMVCDTNNGVNAVVRNSRIQNFYIGGHGADSVNRGTMGYEVYNNKFYATVSDPAWGHYMSPMLDARGGLYTAFDNDLYISKQSDGERLYAFSEKGNWIDLNDYRSFGYGVNGLWGSAYWCTDSMIHCNPNDASACDNNPTKCQSSTSNGHQLGGLYHCAKTVCVGSEAELGWLRSTPCDATNPAACNNHQSYCKPAYMCVGDNYYQDQLCDPSNSSSCNNHPTDCVKVDGDSATGYPCRDQNGYGTTLPDGTQQKYPNLYWNNRVTLDNGNTWDWAAVDLYQYQGDLPSNVVRDRDYCVGNNGNPALQPTSCGGVSNNYKPFTYPYPLDTNGFPIGATSACVLKGDANNDGSINISDVQTCINVILGNDTTHKACSDMNGNSTVDITDCQAIINKILNP